jgi:hypothetical protein
MLHTGQRTFGKYFLRQKSGGPEILLRHPGIRTPTACFLLDFPDCGDDGREAEVRRPLGVILVDFTGISASPQLVQQGFETRSSMRNIARDGNFCFLRLCQALECMMYLAQKSAMYSGAEYK